MRYQLIQHLKTKSKVISIEPNVEATMQKLGELGAYFVGHSYIGNFPIFNANTKVYSVQGLADGLDIVCSLKAEDLAKAQQLTL